MYSYWSHPNQLCMSYITHARGSLYYSWLLFTGSIGAFIHAFIPSVCITTTSDTVKNINNLLLNSGCVRKS